MDFELMYEREKAYSRYCEKIIARLSRENIELNKILTKDNKSKQDRYVNFR
jgi:hypothetical protein